MKLSNKSDFLTEVTNNNQNIIKLKLLWWQKFFNSDQWRRERWWKQFGIVVLMFTGPFILAHISNSFMIWIWLCCIFFRWNSNVVSVYMMRGACYTSCKLLATVVHTNLVGLHIRSMWETICDAWACWSGWNFGPNSDRIPPILKFRIPPPQNENCQRVQIWEFQNTPLPNENCQRVQIREFQNTPKMKIVRESKSESFRIPPKWKLSESKSESFRIPPQMKIVRESKSKSFRIPPQMKIVRESKSESFRIPA